MGESILLEKCIFSKDKNNQYLINAPYVILECNYFPSTREWEDEKAFLVDENGKSNFLNTETNSFYAWIIPLLFKNVDWHEQWHKEKEYKELNP